MSSLAPVPPLRNTTMVRSTSGSFKLVRRPDPREAPRVAQHTRFHSFAGFNYEQPTTSRAEVKAPPRLTHRPQEWERINAPMPAVTSMGHPPPLTRRADHAKEYKVTHGHVLLLPRRCCPLLTPAPTLTCCCWILLMHTLPPRLPLLNDGVR